MDLDGITYPPLSGKAQTGSGYGKNTTEAEDEQSSSYSYYTPAYSPTSPAYSPTSPAYSPTSPAYSCISPSYISAKDGRSYSPTSPAYSCISPSYTSAKDGRSYSPTSPAMPQAHRTLSSASSRFQTESSSLASPSSSPTSFALEEGIYCFDSDWSTSPMYDRSAKHSSPPETQQGRRSSQAQPTNKRGLLERHFIS